MVKPDTSGSGEFYWFESDVIPDSGKTGNISTTTFSAFESDVIPDSGKT